MAPALLQHCKSPRMLFKSRSTPERENLHYHGRPKSPTSQAGEVTNDNDTQHRDSNFQQTYKFEENEAELTFTLTKQQTLRQPISKIRSDNSTSERSRSQLQNRALSTVKKSWKAGLQGGFSPIILKTNLHQGTAPPKEPPMQQQKVLKQVSTPKDVASIRSLEFGKPGTQQFRMLFLDVLGQEVSPWHDIPLYSTDGCLNFVCKTPRGSWAEYEPARNEPSTPLKVKVRQGSPSHFAENAPWNIGMLPKTYADPEQKNESYGGLTYRSGALEVIDIGCRVAWTGDVYSVKPLAAFAMVDASKKLSWIVVAIDAMDERVLALKGARDVEKQLGGTLREIREWLRRCRCVKEGDPAYAFGLNERAVGQLTVARVVAETHASWQLLVDQQAPKGASDLSLTRPANASTYESYWMMYFYPNYLSPTRIELCDPSLDIGTALDEASNDSSSGIDIDPGVWSSTESSEELTMGLGITARQMAALKEREEHELEHRPQPGGAQSYGHPPCSPLAAPTVRQGRYLAVPTGREATSSPNWQPQKNPHSERGALRNSPCRGRQSSSTATMLQALRERQLALQGGRELADAGADSQLPPEKSFSFPAMPPNVPKNRNSFPQRVDGPVGSRSPKPLKHYFNRRGEDAEPDQRLRLSIANCQAWDARGESRFRAQAPPRSPRHDEAWAAPQTGGGEYEDLHPCTGQEAAGLKSPRGEILSGLPPTFDKIAHQLDETEYLHERFNSRLAATKALLGRLRHHAEVTT